MLITGIILFLVNKNSNDAIEIIEDVHAIDLTKPSIITKKILPQKVVYENNFECTSPLYVSDVLIDKQQFKNQSLVNLLNFFDKKGDDVDKVKLILLDSGKYTSKEIRISSNIFSPPVYSTKSVDRALLSSNVNKISSFGKNYKELAGAIRKGDVDPFMDLSVFYGRPKSIIDYFLEFRGGKPNISFFKSLIESGVPITHGTIIKASKSHVPTEILSLMITNLGDNEREYKWKDGLFGKTEYSYVSYAAQVSTVDSLKVILLEGLGDKSDAINTLLKERLNSANKQNFFDLEYTINKNKTFNDKLSLLLEYDIPVSSDLVEKILINSNGITSENISTLVNRGHSIIENKDTIVSANLKDEVNNYAEHLQKAKKNWPEFVFSFDSECKRIPSDSHYRYDNLIKKIELTNIIKKSPLLDKSNILNKLKQYGDIYVDWYYSTLELEKKAPDHPVIKQKNHEEAVNFIEGKLVTESWDEISKALKEGVIPPNYIYYKNSYLIELAIQNNSPQSILFDWYQMSVPIHNNSLNELMYIEKYADFTYFLLKNGKVINKRLKSVVFQATRNSNFKLLELLLNDAQKNEFIKYDEGVSPVSWTLLNYDNDFKRQLDLLLSKLGDLSDNENQLLLNVH